MVSETATETLTITGLQQPVEILKDRWGISHIYAQNQPDLFFAQGFNVARDRLFQLEIWRRRATGTMAEVQGRKALRHDIGARLLRLRADLKEELNHYHPQGEEIITAFVAGINAYIETTEKNPDLLPLEFTLLGIRPGRWTPEVVVSRHNGLYRNVRMEIALAQLVRAIGTDQTKDLLNLHPGNPTLVVAEGIDLEALTEQILDLYNAARTPVAFAPEDIVAAYRGEEALEKLAMTERYPEIPETYFEQDIGSNNWVINGRHTFTGYPIMANDPHRSQQVPSLRYWVHLVAPGWNVIGGGEPALPGISIGHNEYGAWGLTIFQIDQEDLYVYDTNPDNPNQYRYQGHWEDMRVEQETIPVKGEKPVTVDLKFTRHGPVLYEDRDQFRAYALRAAWLEVGCAPYLASLRMDQAKTWDQFREACSYSRTPSENMVWADIEGNIGWQVVGIAPLRNNWNGLLPVPGDGRFEWDGCLPIKALPHLFNPPEGYFATANQDNVPAGYPYPLGLMWTDLYRFARIQEVLDAGDRFTMADMIKLQQDVLSIPARTLVPLLKGLHTADKRTQQALAMLLDWNYVLAPHSLAAALYISWERRLYANVWNLYIPLEVRAAFPGLSLQKMITFLMAPAGHFGSNPTAARDALLIKSLQQAVDDLAHRLGPDMRRWQYGQTRFHHVKIHHLLSAAVKPALRDRLEVGPLARGGNRNTVNNTTNNDNQSSGASFRIIAEVGRWDNSVGTNTPGQSGDPDSPHYADLFVMWANGHYFPVFYSRERVESVTERKTVIKPEG